MTIINSDTPMRLLPFSHNRFPDEEISELSVNFTDANHYTARNTILKKEKFDDTTWYAFIDLLHKYSIDGVNYKANGYIVITGYKLRNDQTWYETQEGSNYLK